MRNAYTYILNEASKKRKKAPTQNAKRVRPGGAPILADVVALLFSRGKRGIAVEELASTFKAADRTTRKWRQQLKDLRFAEYHESTGGPDNKLRIYLYPVYSD